MIAGAEGFGGGNDVALLAEEVVHVANPLVAYGVPTVPTVAAVLFHWLVAYWLAIAVGRSTVGLLAVTDCQRDERSAEGRAFESEPG